jgi:hypothetical protein
LPLAGTTAILRQLLGHRLEEGLVHESGHRDGGYLRPRFRKRNKPGVVVRLRSAAVGDGTGGDRSVSCHSGPSRDRPGS